MEAKTLILILAALMFLSATPLLADTSLPPNPCTDPGKQSDPLARHEYLTCLNEYVDTQHKAITLHTKAANEALGIMIHYQQAPKEGGK